MSAVLQTEIYRSVQPTPVNDARSSIVIYQGCAFMFVSGNPMDARSKPTTFWKTTGEVSVHGRSMANVIKRANDPHNSAYRWFKGDLLVEQS